MTSTLPLHPRHGVHAPTDSTPPRRPGSVRRTSTVDALRSGDIAKNVTLIGRARDLLTRDADTDAAVCATARTEVSIRYGERGPIVTDVQASPEIPGVADLIGVRASSGFRGGIEARTSAQPGTGEFLLLDDVPVCTLVSGYAVLHAGARGDRSRVTTPRNRAGRTTHGADACAGFALGGTIMNAMADGENAVCTGPEAPDVVSGDDPLAWHDMAPALPVDSVRRWRRTDVWRHDGRLLVDNFYRDSHWAPGGRQTVIHEYTVSAVIDEREMIILECEATPRVLPFVECPVAAASAQRLAGLPVSELRARVRAAFIGTSTCTHLNDQLRGLADVEHLARLLP